MESFSKRIVDVGFLMTAYQTQLPMATLYCGGIVVGCFTQFTPVYPGIMVGFLHKIYAETWPALGKLESVRW